RGARGRAVAAVGRVVVGVHALVAALRGAARARQRAVAALAHLARRTRLRAAAAVRGIVLRVDALGVALGAAARAGQPALALRAHLAVGARGHAIAAVLGIVVGVHADVPADLGPGPADHSGRRARGAAVAAAPA